MLGSLRACLLEPWMVFVGCLGVGSAYILSLQYAHNYCIYKHFITHAAV
jgi:hypothetical protein